MYTQFLTALADVLFIIARLHANQICVFLPLQTQYTLSVDDLYTYICTLRSRIVFFACGQLRSAYSAHVFPPNEIILKSRAHLAPTSHYSLSSLFVLNEVV